MSIKTGKVTGYTLKVSGIVQGVGFRPYVYRLACETGVFGYVKNSTEGVVIVMEGEETACTRFLDQLPEDVLPLARIDSLEIHEKAVEGFEAFTIQESDALDEKRVPVAPDMAVCEHCLREMQDRRDRRHGYWLINCTDCGPRYSIINTVPYDRAYTSMAAFAMCPECEEEYRDPASRRYHAQPISCYACGPQLSFHGAAGTLGGEAALQEAITLLKAGRIVAVKGLGGFHLMCDATSETAVSTLRARKHRPSKPFAIMLSSASQIDRFSHADVSEQRWITSRERPIVLVRRKACAEIAEAVAPGIDRLGLFLPYTPLHYRMVEAIDFPLVATSANLSDEPIIRSDSELQEKLGDVIEGILSHDREIINACDDTVMQMVDGRMQMIRLARGFAPVTLTLPFRTGRKILAVGANQKNTMAMAFDDKLVITPHIGDLVGMAACEYFERTLETFKRFYDFEPDLVVCDKHPGYETTRWAEQQHLPIIKVQHHHAHLCAALAEMNSTENVLAFVFDGTGFGEDATIWGGEVLQGDTSGFERVGHLLPFRLLGGEKAVREPWRVALSLLFECFTLDEVLALNLEVIRHAGEKQIRLLHTAWLKGINAPLATSMGRLFDAVASLAGIVQEVSYEGESGLKIETAVQENGDDLYTLHIDDGAIDWRPMIRQMVWDRPERIPWRFIASLASLMTTIASHYKARVVLTGGVFQNRTLLEQVLPQFEKEGVDCFIPSRFPVNDGAVALGQLWHALYRTR